MVAEARHNDAPRLKRMDQLLEGLRCQIGLVGDGDQGGVRHFGQGAQADGDRAADAVFRMRVLDGCQGKPGQRVNQAMVEGHDGDDRPKAGVEEAASGFPHQRLTAPGFE